MIDMCVCVYVKGTQLEKVKGGVSMRKGGEEERKEGRQQQDPKERRPLAEPFGPGLIISIILTEMPPGLAKPERDRTKPKCNAREAGSCLGLPHSGSECLGLACSQPVTVWLRISW